MKEILGNKTCNCSCLAPCIISTVCNLKWWLPNKEEWNCLSNLLWESRPRFITGILLSETVRQDCVFNLKWLCLISIILILFLAGYLLVPILCLLNHVSFYVSVLKHDSSWVDQSFQWIIILQDFASPVLTSTHSRCDCSSGGWASPSQQHMQEISVILKLPFTSNS